MLGKLASRPPRSVWDLLDDAFDLYRARFLHFAALAAVLFLPAEALSVVVSGEVHAWFLTQRLGQESSTTSLLGFGEFLAQNGIRQVPLALSQVFLGAAIAQSLWEELHGRVPTTNQILVKVLRRTPRYLFIGLLCGLVNVIAFCFFGIGHWFSSVLFFTLPATIQLEKAGFWASLRRIRSRQPQSLWFRSLGLLFLTEVVVGLLYWGIRGLLTLGLTLIPTPTGTDSTNLDLQQYFLKAAAGSLCQYLLAPVSLLTAALLYIDLRIRRDALDLVTAAEDADLPLGPEKVTS